MRYDQAKKLLDVKRTGCVWLAEILRLCRMALGMVCGATGALAETPPEFFYQSAGGDLADPAGWGVQQIPADAAVCLNKSGVYTLSRDLSLGSVTLDASDVTFDFTSGNRCLTLCKPIAGWGDCKSLFQYPHDRNRAVTTLKGGVWYSPNRNTFDFVPLGNTTHASYTVEVTDGCVITNVGDCTTAERISNCRVRFSNSAHLFTTGRLRVGYVSGTNNVLEIRSGSRVSVGGSLYSDQKYESFVYDAGDRIVVRDAGSALAVGGAETIVGLDYARQKLEVTEGASLDAPQSRIIVGRNATSTNNWVEISDGAVVRARSLLVRSSGNRIRLAAASFDSSYGSTNSYWETDIGQGDNGASVLSNCVGNVLEIVDGATFRADRFFVHGFGNTVVVSNATLMAGSYERGGAEGYSVWLGRQTSSGNALVLRGRTPKVCPRYEGWAWPLMLQSRSVLRYEIPPEGYPDGFVPMVLNGIYAVSYSSDSSTWTQQKEHVEIECSEWAARPVDEATELVLARSLTSAARNWIEAHDFGLPTNVICFVRGGDLVLRRAPRGGEQRLRTGPRADPNRFLVGAYSYRHGFLQDEAHVKELRDCDLDYVVGVPIAQRQTLDLLYKYGIGCVASGVVNSWHRWNQQPDPAAESLEKYARALDAFNGTTGFADHPAIWAITLCDEPSEPGLDGMGEVCALFNEKCPDTPAHVNLFAPSFYGTYGVTNRYLLVTNAVDYLDSYCRQLPLGYISYDYYPYSDTGDGSSSLYRSCKITADACRKWGREYCLIAQLNTRDEDDIHCTRKLTADNLRRQAYVAMAFGVRAISWACWGPGWWTNNVYNADGTRNDDRIEVLKEVNPELHRLGAPYMRFRREATSFVDFPYIENTLGLQPSLDSYSDGFFTGLEAEDGAPLVIGQMRSRSGRARRAVFVAAAGDSWGTKQETHRIVFGVTPGRGDLSAYGTGGELTLQEERGRYSFELKDNRAALIVVDESPESGLSVILR